MPIRQPTRSRPLRAGLSIAEVMVSLAIASMLLVGVAAAYSASADGVEGNDRFFRATQGARVTMNQLITEIRRADSVVVAPTYDSIIITRRQDLRLPEEQSREYMYNPVSKMITLKIYFKRFDGTTYQSPNYSMVGNVAEARFGPPDQVGGVDVRVPVTLVIAVGNNTVRLSDTTGPRKLSIN